MPEQPNRRRCSLDAKPDCVGVAEKEELIVAKVGGVKGSYVGIVTSSGESVKEDRRWAPTHIHQP